MGDGGVMCGPGTRVSVELDWDTLEPAVMVCLTEDQGEMSTWSDVFACLEQGALYGVRFALKVANTLPCTVRITELTGEREHTNPTVVAAAAAYAVWGAVGYQPPSEVHARVQGEVESSRHRSRDYLGLFEMSR